MDTILAWTLYTYLGLFVIKIFTLGWLVFGSWDTQQIGMCGKVAQFLSLYIFSNFLPYGDFIVDLGYKMYATPDMEGSQELYPEHYVIRRGPTKLKGYKGKVGGHFILMLNGLLTTVINVVLLVVVLTYFTPAIFPSVDASLAEHDQAMYVFLYALVVLHLVATTWLTTSMVLRSLLCPYDKKHLQ